MTPSIYLQLLPGQILALCQDEQWSAPLIRGENGRISGATRERIANELRAFLQKRSIKPGAVAVAALPARGATLRALQVPKAARQEFEQVLRFQIEQEFPVSPDDLAWGWQAAPESRRISDPTRQTQGILVAAVKRESVTEWQDLFTSLGLQTVWTLAAFGRSALVPSGISNFAQLHLEAGYSELLLVENESPSLIRNLAWGGESLESAVQQLWGIPHSEALQRIEQWREGSLSPAEAKDHFSGLLQAEASRLAAGAASLVGGKTIYLSGVYATLPGFSEALRKTFETMVELLPADHSNSTRATWEGLEQAFSVKRKGSLITLGAAEIRAETKQAQISQWKWPAIAAALLLAALFMRYAEALINKPRLARKIDEIKSFQKKLPDVDREIEFLQFLQTNQPPCLDALHAIAAAAAPGAKVDGFTMNRRGDLSIKATMQNPQQATDMRAKLFESGMFSDVTLEEQNPAPDGQKVTIRLSAALKPPGELKEILSKVESSSEATNKPAATPSKGLKVVKK
jgi:Tfp pilus assembly PilM family ATPase